jgi:hypothetical protein
MTHSPRALLMTGGVLLALAGVLLVTLRLTYGERSAFINVRWAASVDEAARQAAERVHALVPVEFREQRTWLYELTDVSREHVRQLVQDPAVEDTHHVDRARFRIQGTAERGNYPGGGAAWIPRLIEFLVRVSLLLGAAALVVGGYRTWRNRRGPKAPAPAP